MLVAIGHGSTAILSVAEPSARPEDSLDRFANLSLEDLLKVPVSAVSRTEGSLKGAPAAVTLITSDDLRSAGVRRLPEAFRLVPGMEVAQSKSSSWAVSARGFNDLYANKLLVMIDGRSIYTPLYSGVYWNNHNPVIEDIDRIEVVRGPGATVWGANAVNGVVNIVSKSAFETIGGLASVGGGTELEGDVALRYGFKLGDTAALRLSFRETWTDDSILTDGSKASDDDRIINGGFRFDWHPDTRNSFELSGEVHTETSSSRYLSPSFLPPYSSLVFGDALSDGGFVQAKWEHRFDDHSFLSAGLGYDHYRNTSEITERRDTFHFDIQFTTVLRERHTVSLGADTRTSHDTVAPAQFLALRPESVSYNQSSAFLQDEISLVPDRLKLTLGSKFETSDAGGFQPQPGLRLAWTPTDASTVWFSASKAVRIPSRAELNGDGITQILAPGTTTPPNPLPLALHLLGNPAARSESLVALESGLRIRANRNLQFELAAYYNDYANVQGFTPGTPGIAMGPGGPYIDNPLLVDNSLEGASYGFELNADWRATETLRFKAAYSLLESHLRPTPQGQIAGSSEPLASSPNQQVMLSTLWQPIHNWEFSSHLRWVDELGYGPVPSYFGLDLRIAWAPRPDLEISITGKNLLQSSHAEFGDDRLAPSGMHAVQRSVFGQVTWKF